MTQILTLITRTLCALFLLAAVASATQHATPAAEPGLAATHATL